MRFLTLILLIAAFACKSKPSDNGTSSSPYVFTDTVLVSIGAKDFAAVAKAKPNMPILDLRNEQFYKIAHINHAVNLDPSDSLFYTRIGGFGRDQEYAVYCQKGEISFKVAEEMKRMGFRRIYHLQKGLSNWRDSGQALQR